MHTQASVSILANPTATIIDVLAFENCRISSNNKTAIKGLLFYLLCLEAIAHKRQPRAISTLTGSNTTHVTCFLKPGSGTTARPRREGGVHIGPGRGEGWLVSQGTPPRAGLHFLPSSRGLAHGTQTAPRRACSARPGTPLGPLGDSGSGREPQEVASIRT